MHDLAGDRGSVRNNFLAVAQKFSPPGLATSSAELVPAPSFDSSRRVSHTLLILHAKMTMSFYAGDGGIEPPTARLECAVIPLN